MPEELKTVILEPLDRWGWNCPKCGAWNELEDDPNCQDEVACDICERKFKHNILGEQ